MATQLSPVANTQRLQSRLKTHMKLTHQLCCFIVENNKEPTATDNEVLAEFLRVRREAKGKPGRRTWPECLEILSEYGLGMLFDVARFRPDIFPDRRIPSGVVIERHTPTPKAETQIESKAVVQPDLFQRAVAPVTTDTDLSKQVCLADLSNLMTRITTGVNFTQSYETLYLSKPVA